MISSNQTVADFIAKRQTELNLTDADLATALGYSSDKIINMFKTDQMRLPVNKITPLAVALQVDVVEVTRMVLTQQMPELWSVLEPLMPLGALSPTEVNLIKHLRTLPGASTAAAVVFSGESVIALVATK